MDKIFDASKTCEMITNTCICILHAQFLVLYLRILLKTLSLISYTVVNIPICQNLSTWNW